METIVLNEPKQIYTVTIGESEVILKPLGENQGKIIIASPSGNFSHYWGSMGEGLLDFVKSVSKDYFVKTLKSPYDKGRFDAKASVKNIRAYIKSELKYELPWHKYMEDQKDLRALLKKAESCESQHEFVDTISNIPNRLCSINREFDDIIRSFCCNEPWHFIETTDSYETIFLGKLFDEFKVKLNKKDYKISVETE